MKRIIKASAKERKLIEDLRISEFSRSTEFTLLNPTKLLWSETDDKSIVLLVTDENNTAISTMRAIPVRESLTAEGLIYCSIPAYVSFPALIFTSAATLKSFRRKGFNQLTRLYFLKYAQKNNIRTLISPVYKNAPRIDFMASLGYTFETPEKNWQKKLNPTSERQLGLLTYDYFDQAIDIIEKANQDLINEFPWVGHELPSLHVDPITFATQ